MIAHETKFASALMAYLHDASSLLEKSLQKDNHQISSQNRQAMKVTNANVATIPR
jgi:hypothetical protein